MKRFIYFIFSMSILGCSAKPGLQIGDLKQQISNLEAINKLKSQIADLQKQNSTSSTPLPATTPTPLPTATPATLPTATPTPLPTATPIPLPTATPATLRTATPTPLPIATPTPLPIVTPTPLPTASPTPLPSSSPSNVGPIPSLYAPTAPYKCMVNFSLDWPGPTSLEQTYIQTQSYTQNPAKTIYAIATRDPNDSYTAFWIVLPSINVGSYVLDSASYATNTTRLQYTGPKFTNGNGNTFSNANALVIVSIKGNTNGNIWGNFSGNIYNSSSNHSIVGIFGCYSP